MPISTCIGIRPRTFSPGTDIDKTLQMEAPPASDSAVPEAYARWLELSPELAAVAQEQLKEPSSDEERVQKAEALLASIATKGIPTEAGWLSYSPQGYAVMYLRWAKWDVAKAAARMQSANTWMHDAMKGQDSLALRGTDFQKMHDVGFVRPLGRQARSGGLLQLMRPGIVKGKIEDPWMLVRYNAWSLRRALYDKKLQVHGMMMLETFEGMTFMDAIRFTGQLKPVMQLQMRFMNDCAPFRMQQLVMLHTPTFFSFLYAFASPFLSKKMKSRIRMFGKDFAKLHSEVADPAVLPADFGGTHADNGEEYYQRIMAEEAAEDKAAATAAL